MHKKALVLAIITTFLWSSSYILNKIAFQQGIRPLTLSALRYFLAGLLMLIITSRKTGAAGRSKPVLPFRKLLVLGILGYTIAQGMQYVAQSYLSPTQSSLFLSIGNTSIVILIDAVWLKENQSKSSYFFLMMMIMGILCFYYPISAGSFSWTGLGFMLLSSVGYGTHLYFNRYYLSKFQIDPSGLVGYPMLFGSLFLLVLAFLAEGLPQFNLTIILIILYLAIISGALGFTLWTYSQKELSAFESSSINNLMLIEIAGLDVLFFSRRFTLLQSIGIIVVFIAVFLVNTRRIKNREKP